jgi:hypothetical protein
MQFRASQNINGSKLTHGNERYLCTSTHWANIQNYFETPERKQRNSGRAHPHMQVWTLTGRWELSQEKQGEPEKLELRERWHASGVDTRHRQSLSLSLSLSRLVRSECVGRLKTWERQTSSAKQLLRLAKVEKQTGICCGPVKWSASAHFRWWSGVQIPVNQFGLIWSKLNTEYEKSHSGLICPRLMHVYPLFTKARTRAWGQRPTYSKDLLSQDEMF